MFAKMNTAYHRTEALEAIENKDYKLAYKHYDAAIEKYPKFHPESELSKRDLEGLKQRRDSAKNIAFELSKK